MKHFARGIRRSAVLFLLLSVLLCSVCSCSDTAVSILDFLSDVAEELNDIAEQDSSEGTAVSTAETEKLTESGTETPAEISAESSEESTAETFSLEEDGWYYTPEDVALYIVTYGTLPDNYITKQDAMNLGWDSSKGNLWDVADGKCIGGDTFGNYEGLLPKNNGKYYECDVNYSGGFRGADRLIFDKNGDIWYTCDHYESFTQLYDQKELLEAG